MMLLLALQMLFLAAVGAAAGRLVLPARPAGSTRIGEAGFSAISGLVLLAGLLNGLGALHVPRTPALATAYIVAAAGAVRGFRHRGTAGASLHVEAGVALTVLALSASPLLVALSGPPWAHDAVTIWWPKAMEVRAGKPPDFHPTDPFTIPEGASYPRGLGWLCNLVAPVGPLDCRLVRLVPCIFLPLVALGLLAAGERVQNRKAGLWAGLLWLLIPDGAARAPSGLADTAMAGAILMAGVALTFARTDARWWPAVGAAALGGTGIKDDGIPLFAMIALLVLLEVFRGRHRELAFAALALLLIAVPWLLLRRHASSWQIRTLPFQLDHPPFLLARIGATPIELSRLLWDKAALCAAVDANLPPRPSIGFYALVTALLLVIPRGRPGFWTVPILVHYAAALPTFAFPIVPPQQQIVFSAERVLLHGLPFLLLAAAHRLTRAPPQSTLPGFRSAAGTGRS